MERVYVPDPIVVGRASVTGPEAHHLARVRRAATGTEVELFDGRGHAFIARVASVARDRVELAVEGPSPVRRAPAVALTLATAVPKGERFDWLVEKATELGVARLVPIRTERSVVDPRSSKLDRLRRRVVEACKQSGRNTLMELGTPRDWADLADEGPEGLGLVADPGPGMPIGRVVAARRATVAIGPEGGFTPVEVERAVRDGWKAVGLGPNILRVETAGLAACAALLAINENEETRWSGT